MSTWKTSSLTFWSPPPSPGGGTSLVMSSMVGQSETCAASGTCPEICTQRASTRPFVPALVMSSLQTWQSLYLIHPYTPGCCTWRTCIWGCAFASWASTPSRTADSTTGRWPTAFVATGVWSPSTRSPPRRCTASGTTWPARNTLNVSWPVSTS